MNNIEQITDNLIKFTFVCTILFVVFAFGYIIYDFPFIIAKNKGKNIYYKMYFEAKETKEELEIKLLKLQIKKLENDQAR